MKRMNERKPARSGRGGGADILLLRCMVSILMTAVLLCFGGAVDAATLTVTSAGDSGAGTLRAAITNAAAGDTIVFHSSVTTVNLNSYLFVNKALTINGPVSINQNGSGHRVLYVTGDCTFYRLRITGGNTGSGNGTQGAGVINYANLTMNDCIVTENSGGGGIHNGKNLTLNNCVINYNTASGDTVKAGGISSTDYGYNSVVLTMTNCIVENNVCNNGMAGGIYNGVKGKLVMSRCNVRYNGLNRLGGGMYLTSGSETSLVDYCIVTNNEPDQICCGYGVSYTTDGTCTIGTSSGSASVALSGMAEGAAPEPRKTVGEQDVKAVERDLGDEGSSFFKAVKRVLSADLGGLAGGVSATLYNAFTYEDVPLSDTSGFGELVVEFTASWPEYVRYYAALAEYQDAEADSRAVRGYAIPERGVQFEIKPGQELPEGVTPPDFYEEGEGLMTWRNVIEDNGPYDHNRQTGVVTFRVISVRAEAEIPAQGSSGCGVGVLPVPFAFLLGIPLLIVRWKGR